MASINSYLTKILEAKYGEEVRNSIHNAIKAINDENTSTANKINNMSVSATKLPEGYNPTVSIMDNGNQKSIVFGIPAGDIGPQGEPGDKGPKGDPVDILINETSILSNGIAHVPIGTDQQLGVVSSSPENGTRLVDGTMELVPETETGIDARSSNPKPITPSNLDYAVKAAMCDGKGTAWPSADQKAAQKRMGVDAHDLQIKMIMTAAKGILYTTREDSTDAMEKIVPAESLSCATVDRIGGKSVVNTDATLTGISTTGITSSGSNLNRQLDFSSIVQKYFPTGMKSAGSVYDEINLELGVAIQRIQRVCFDGNTLAVGNADNAYADRESRYNYAYPSPTNMELYGLNKKNGHAFSTIGTNRGTAEEYLTQGGVELVGNTICIYIKNVAIEGNTKEEYLARFNEALQKNPVWIDYELAEPVITPISEGINNFIEVEAGGTLTILNSQGEYYYISLPNKVTWMLRPELQ